MHQRLQLTERSPILNRLANGHGVLLEHVDVPHDRVGSLDVIQYGNALGGLVNYTGIVDGTVLELVSQVNFLLLQLIDFPVSGNLHMIESLRTDQLAIERLVKEILGSGGTYNWILVSGLSGIWWPFSFPILLFSFYCKIFCYLETNGDIYSGQELDFELIGR